MMKKIIIGALAATLFFIFGAYFWWQDNLKPVSNSEQKKTFTISRGENLDSVSVRLDQEGFVKSALAFKLFVYQSGLKNRIQAGSFYLSASMDLPTIAQNLTHGSQDVWVTFPEGLRREEVADKLTNSLADFDRQRFLSLTQDDEGSLFPDTYLIPKDVSAQKVREILLANYEKKVANLDFSLAGSLNERQVIILASIIEREARTEKDRKIVAGILLKRINAAWPLQVDATVQYALGSQRCSGKLDCEWWQPVISSDLKIISAYNTYTNKGLPPGPICNPSLSSIKAVLVPTETDFWFYLNDSTGTMHYGKTAQEHDQNVENYLR